MGPVLTVIGLAVCVTYMTWAAFQAQHYWWGSYLSPLYSPVLFGSPEGTPGAAPAEHVLFGPWPSWWPPFIPASPAFWILVFPGAFRFTCYYYRKAYYRSFTATPPGCAVCPVRQTSYRGETRWLLFQNWHRYAMYFAVIFIFILAYDALISFVRVDPVTGAKQFGIGVGSLVLTLNVVLLSGYTFGCHSFRHVIGGGRNRFSGASGKPSLFYRIWQKASWLNARHMLFAWTSLYWVTFCDFYIRMVSMGYIRDYNTWD